METEYAPARQASSSLDQLVTGISTPCRRKSGRKVKTLLVTGSNGLIGSEMIKHFDGLEWRVHGLDNNMRADFSDRRETRDGTKTAWSGSVEGSCIMNWTFANARAFLTYLERSNLTQ